MEHQTNMFNKHAAAQIKTLRQIEESCDGVYNMFYWQIFPASFSSTQRKHCGAKESPSLPTLSQNQARRPLLKVM